LSFLGHEFNKGEGWARGEIHTKIKGMSLFRDKVWVRK